MTATPQYSPDGKWWWDGTQWVAVPDPAAAPVSAPPGPTPVGYGAPQPGYGTPEMGFAAQAYASWGQRVGASLIDGFAPFIAVLILSLVLGAVSDALGLLVMVIGYIAALAWSVYQVYLGGKTGQSLGKEKMGIRLLSEQTGQPIGGGMGIARWLLHIVDSLPCSIGYLWPLWDAKKQTFADKILNTIVVRA